MPFWEVNRSDGTMAPSWRDPDLLPRVAIALTVGQSADQVALPCYQKPLFTKQLWFTHNIGNRTGFESRTKVLCDTGALLYSLIYQGNWELVT